MKHSHEDPLLECLDPETGEPPERRVKSALSAEQILAALKDADEESSRTRAQIDAMIDGEPPYDAKKLRDLGQSYRCNLNFLEGAAAIEAAETGYLDLTNAVDTIADIQIDTGDPLLDPERSRIVSEEFDRLMRESWKGFEVNKQLLAHFFVSQGVAIAFFEDNLNWQWRVSRLGDFLIPRGTEVGEGNIEIAFVCRTYRPHQLYEFIRNKEAAEAVGWNVEEVRKAIFDAVYSQGEDYSADNWEELERQLKNNDLHVGLARGREIKLAHGWVQEFSGKVSHFIIRQKGNGEEFLYYGREMYKSFNQAVIPFLYGVGNGEIHSIRGLGWKIFPFVQVSNRLRSQAIDGAILSSSIMLQPKEEEDAEDLSIIHMGACSILPPNLEVVTANLPNIGTQVLPVIREMGLVMENNTGSYRTRASQPSGQERTKFEVQAQLQKEATLTVSAMNLFYIPWGDLLEESYRRLMREDYTVDDPGGKLAFEFFRRCAARGVSREILRKVKSVKPVRAIGHGSPEARLVALDELMALAGQLDDVGRYNLLRDRIATRMGYAAVDRYVPKRNTSRPTQDQKNAVLENTSLRLGIQVPVFPDDLPMVHLAAHIPVAIELFEQAQVSGGVNPAQFLQPITAILEHCNQHLAALQLDKSQEAQAFFGNARKILSQVNEAVQHLSLQLEKMQREQMEAAAAGEQVPQDRKVSPMGSRDVIYMRELEARLQAERAAHEQAMKHREEEFQQKLRHRDLEKASELLAMGEAE